MSDQYVPDMMAENALCTAADRRSAQYAVPDATDDDLALADTSFVNDVHQAILRSEWFAERLAAERERIARNIQAAADAAWTGTPRNAYLDAVRIAREGA